MTGPHGGWMAHPDAGPPDGTLFLEVFGRLDAFDPARAAGDGSLWSALRSRSETMGWERRSETGGLWSTNEAELIVGAGASRIGWAQVGVDPGASPALVIPAFVQCLEDALGRFGQLETHAVQLTASRLQPAPGPYAASIASWLAWFGASPGPAVEAVVSADRAFLERHGSALLERVRHLESPFFRVGPLVPVLEEHRVDIAVEAPVTDQRTPSDRGIRVRLPEWSPAAVGWVLTLVIEAACSTESPVPDFVARLTRLR